MNIAIQVTCLLTEAADEGVELTVVGNKLKVPAGSHIDAELRHRLREHQAAIVQRLNYDATHPDPFVEFINQHCLFCAGEGLGIPINEMDAAYLQWTQHTDVTPSSLVQLHKRLGQLGCEAVYIQRNPWWENVALWQSGYAPMQPERPQQPKQRDYEPKASVEVDYGQKRHR